MIRMLPTSRRFTPVPDSFILESMSKMSSTVIKVYLFLLYQFHYNYEYLDLDEVADRLNLTETDIFRAIRHLTKENLLLSETKDGEYLSVSLPEITSPVTKSLRQSEHSGGADSNDHAAVIAADRIDLSAPAAPEIFPAQSNPLPSDVQKSSAAAEAQPNFFASPAANSVSEENMTAPKKPDDLVSEVYSPVAKPATADTAKPVMAPAAGPAEHRPAYSAELIEDFAKNKDGDQLIFYTQTLLKKNLTPNDLHILFGLKDWLKMSDTLIYFLIEHCAERNHTHLSYIEKIAIDWHEKQIETVEQAKDYLASYPSYYYTVLKAYGIYNLAPIPAQIKMIDKWLKSYQLPMDLIVYACEKTILQAGKPELNYTDSILKAWKEKQLLSREQVDQAEANKPKKAPTQAAAGRNGKPAAAIKTTTFNNYTQRHEDYDAIEKKALAMRIQKKESEQ